MKKILAIFAIVLLLIGGCTIKPIISTPSSVKEFGNIDSPQKALVIGNSKYEYGPLVNPTNDANEVAEILKEMNFYVVKATNLDLDEMTEVIGEFEKNLAKSRTGSDVALFYFSGHGAGIDADGKNYLFPINNGNSEEETAVSGRAIHTDTILTAMKTVNRSGVNLMFLDACRDQPYIGSSKSRFRGGMYPPKSSVIGTVQAYATAFGRTASDNRKGRNSLYTKYLLKILQVAKDTPVGIEDILMKVKELVKKDSKGKQAPSHIYSINGGKVCLGFKDCKQPI